MKKGNILLAGLAGGILPYLLGMAREAIAGTPARATFLYQDPGYWLGMFLFGLAGAVVAYFFGATDLRKALAMGASAPGLVLGIGVGGADHATTSINLTAQRPAVHGWLIRAALAQPPAAAQQGHDTLWVRLQGLDSVAGAHADLFLVGQPPGTAGAATFRFTPSSPEAAIRRSAARGFYLVVQGIQTDTVELSSIRRDTLTLRVSIKDQSFLSGFARTLGIRSVAQKRVIVSAVRNP